MVRRPLRARDGPPRKRRRALGTERRESIEVAAIREVPFALAEMVKEAPPGAADLLREALPR